MGNFQF